MSKKKISNKSKARLIIFGIPSIFIIIALFVQLSLYAYQIYNLKQEYSNLKEEHSKLQEEEKEKRTEIERMNDPEYKARYARETYSYTKNGEYKIIINDKEEEKEELSFKDYVINNIKNINIDYPYIIYGTIGITIFIIIIKSRKKEED